SRAGVAGRRARPRAPRSSSRRGRRRPPHGARLACRSTLVQEAPVVEEGAPAPDFELQSDEGETVTLSALRGKPVVLYFYPRDDTPGCTPEACEFGDAYDRFREQGVENLGVSPDAEASPRQFKAQYHLPFPLLADTDHSVAEK